MYYIELFESLYRNKIKYLIAGGLAINLYGIPRVTMDVDLLVDLNSENINNLNKVLQKLNYEPIYPDMKSFSCENIDYWIKYKNMIAFSFKNVNEPFKQIDILLEPSKDFKFYWNKREIRKINNIEIYLLSIDDLVEMKRKSNRIQDKKDIEFLEKVKNERT